MRGIASGLFANMTMTDLEVHWLQVLKDSHGIVPMILYRYVDDWFFRIDKNHLDTVLNVFNSYYPKLLFTHEIEKIVAFHF